MCVPLHVSLSIVSIFNMARLLHVEVEADSLCGILVAHEDSEEGHIAISIFFAAGDARVILLQIAISETILFIDFEEALDEARLNLILRSEQST